MNKLNIFDALHQQIHQIISLISLKAFDTSTLEGRSKERYRRILLTALGFGGSRGLKMLSALVSVPLTINYLGTERYGLWMTIASMVTILSFTDLGISNGLLTAISTAIGHDEHELVHKYISSAFFILLSISLSLWLMFLALYSLIPWGKIYNVSSTQAISEAGPATALFVLCFLLNTTLSIVQQTQMGYQEGFINSIWNGVGNLLGFIGILITIYFQANLMWLVLATMGSQVLGNLFNGIIVFGFRRPYLRPSLSKFDFVTGRKILKTGLLFFVLQISGVLTIEASNIIIAQLLGAEYVTQYIIPLQLFAIPNIFLALLWEPLWPAYGEALARRDVIWVRKTLIRSVSLGLAVSISFAFFLVLFGNQIIHLWVGNVVTPSLALLIGLGLQTIYSCSFGGTLSKLLNGANIVGFQVITAMSAGLSNVFLAIFLVPKIGLIGVVYSFLIAQVIFILLPTAIYIPKLFSQWLSSSLKQITA